MSSLATRLSELITAIGADIKLKANLASPTFTGVPAAPTAAPGVSTTQLATTAFVTAADILKANLASPTFTGTVTIPTLSLTGNGTLAAGSVLTWAADTNLYRSAADVLKTDDLLLLPASQNDAAKTLGLAVGSGGWMTYLQSGINNSGDSIIAHNAYVLYSGINLLDTRWEASHGSFGSRGIAFRLSHGITFFADNVASTADAAFTPTERMRLTNDGTLLIGTTTDVAAFIGLPAGTTPATGGILWGTDTNLYRSAANVLTTDDTFSAAVLQVAGVALASTHLSDVASIAHINAGETISAGWVFQSSLTMKSATAVNANMSLIGSTLTNPGYIQWLNTSAVRLAYFGYDNIDLALNVENGATFVVNTGAQPVGGALIEQAAMQINNTLQFGANVATQRATIFAAPTWTGDVPGRIITTGATLVISGAPIASTNMAITNPYAFWVQSGKSQFDGIVSATALQIADVALASTHLSDTAALARLAAPTFTGVPAAPTAAVDTNTTQLATTAFVIAQAYAKLAAPTLTGAVVASGTLRVGGTAGIVTGALIAVVKNGNSIEWGHSNVAGYRSTIGANVSNGTPFLAFSGEAGTVNDSYQTRGIIASIIKSDLLGGFVFGNVALATGDSQAFVQRLALTPAGILNVLSGIQINSVALASTHLSDTAALARLAGPTFTGVPAAPTAAVDTNTTQLATTAFVIAQAYAKLASPVFTGTVTTPAINVNLNSSVLPQITLGRPAATDGVSSGALMFSGPTIDHQFISSIPSLTAATRRFRFARSGSGDPSAATSFISLAGDDKIYFGSAEDTNLYRSAANTLKTDDDMWIAGRTGIAIAPTGNAIFTLPAGTTPATGGIMWGTDVTLYRSAANVLKTDDTFIVQASGAADSAIAFSNADQAVGTWWRADGSNLVISTKVGDIYLGYAGRVGHAVRFGTGGAALSIGESNGAMTWGGDTNLYRYAANTLKTDDDLIVGGYLEINNRMDLTSTAASGHIQYRAFSFGDTQPRWQLVNGVMTWGSGSITPDTNLYRSAANTLKTDDDFIAARVLSDGSVYAATDLATRVTIGAVGPSSQSGITFQNNEVNLYRSATNILKTDDAFQAASYAVGTTPLASTHLSDSAALERKTIIATKSVLDIGLSGQVKAGRPFVLADFTTLLGLTAPLGLFNLTDTTNLGTGGNLTNTGSVAFGAGITGAATEAATFTNGDTAKRLWIADSAPLSPRTVAVGAWFRTGKQGTDQQVMAKYAANQMAFQFFVSGALGTLCFSVSNSGTVEFPIWGSTRVDDNCWHFGVGTYDGATVRVYVDGVFEGSTKATGGAMFDSTAPFNIGSRSGDASIAAALPFFGAIDEAFITADVLSDEQIRLLYCTKIAHGASALPTDVKVSVNRKKKGGPFVSGDFPSQPVRLYNFTAGALTDAGSGAVTLTNNNAAKVIAGVDGVADGAFDFVTASTQWLSSTDAGLPAGTTSRSYGAWFKKALASGDAVMGWGTLNSADARIQIDSFGVVTASSAADTISASVPSVIDGLWHFIVCTEENAPVDGVKRKLYIDGRLVGTSLVMNSITLAGANKFGIGGVSAVNHFQGQIDGVFVHSVVLTSVQIAKLYAVGSQALSPSLKNAGDHIEAIDATSLYAIFDSLESQNTVNLEVN